MHSNTGNHEITNKVAVLLLYERVDTTSMHHSTVRVPHNIFWCRRITREISKNMLTTIGNADRKIRVPTGDLHATLDVKCLSFGFHFGFVEMPWFGFELLIGLGWLGVVDTAPRGPAVPGPSGRVVLD